MWCLNYGPRVDADPSVTLPPDIAAGLARLGLVAPGEDWSPSA